MTAEGYKTFINGSVMASFMEGIVDSSFLATQGIMEMHLILSGETPS